MIEKEKSHSIKGQAIMAVEAALYLRGLNSNMLMVMLTKGFSHLPTKVMLYSMEKKVTCLNTKRRHPSTQW